MSLRRGALLWLVLAATLGLSLGSGVSSDLKAEPAELHFEMPLVEARKFAQVALGRNKFALAAKISRQILAVQPQDSGAQLVLIAALSRGGQPEEAEAVGKAAFATAKTQTVRFQAAFLTAEALSKQDKVTAAKWWLRRAANSGSDNQDRTMLRQAFQGLDARAPLRLDLSVAGGPSNNVNGGSLHDEFLLWGYYPIPIDQALAGYTTSETAKLSYRITQNSRLSLSGYASVSDQQVWLTSASKALAPNAKGSDFSSHGVNFGVKGSWIAKPDLMLSFLGQAGKRHYGNGQNSKNQLLDFKLLKALKSKAVVGLEFSTAASQDPQRAGANTLRYAVDASFSQPVKMDSIITHIGGSVTASEAAGLAYRAGSLGVNYQKGVPIKGISVSAFGEIELRDYWKAPASKLDMRVQAGISGELSRFSVYGYVPRVTLSATRSMSEFVTRDTSNVSVAFELNSSF